MPEYENPVSGQKTPVVQIKDSVSSRTWTQPLVFKQITNESQTITFPNSDGTGYGFFRMDSSSKDYFIQNYQNRDSLFSDPVFRGAMLVNIWENMLRDGNPTPEYLITNILTTLPVEQNPLLVDYLLGNLQTAWWTFLSDQQRNQHQQNVEKVLWELLNKTKDKGIKTSYFRSFKNLALTDDGWKKLESLWNAKLVIKDLVLSEDDKISLAYELALKSPDGAKPILDKQLENTKNPDRKARMQFVIPALNPDEAKRDAFFETLKKEENREKEAWVLDAVSFLNHPLRQRSALKYLRPSLDLLREIQLTGDIFFPTRWLHSTFAGHSTKEAADIAGDFLIENPKYPYFLKNKILQETDMLNRAVKLKK